MKKSYLRGPYDRLTVGLKINIFRSLSPSTLTPITPFPSEHLAEAAEFAGMFQNYDEFSWKSKQFQEHEALKCLK